MLGHPTITEKNSKGRDVRRQTRQQPKLLTPRKRSSIPSVFRTSARMRKTSRYQCKAFSRQQLAAGRGKQCCTCNVPYAWHSTCSHRKSHDQSTHSGRRADCTPECGGRTEAGIAALTGPCTAVEGESKPGSRAAADSNRPRDQLSSSRGCWARCEGPTAASTRTRSG